MRTFKSIERSKGESTGVVRFVENGHEKGARFDKNWTDDAVLKHFKIEKPAAETEPVPEEKKGKAK